jgi:predicted dienelactone hydrolase
MELDLTLTNTVHTLIFLQLMAISHAARSQEAELLHNLSSPGAYGIGVTTLLVINPKSTTPAHGKCRRKPSRKLLTEVWYPARDPSSYEDRNTVPAVSEASFPLVLFAHGFGSTRIETKYIGMHLASHGYIVAAPDFPLSSAETVCGLSPDDVAGQVSDIIHMVGSLGRTLIKAGGSIGKMLAAQLDSSRIGLAGYSLGGTTVVMAGEIARSVKAVATLAPAACPLYLPNAPQKKKPALKMPSLIVHGSADGVLPIERNTKPLFAASANPKYLVTIQNGTHAGFLNRKGLYLNKIANQYKASMDSFICNTFDLSKDPKSPAALCDVCKKRSGSLPLETKVMRQQELTKALLLAFFNSYLLCKKENLSAIQKRLYQENKDLTGVFKGKTMDGLSHCQTK